MPRPEDQQVKIPEFKARRIFTDEQVAEQPPAQRTIRDMISDYDRERQARMDSGKFMMFAFSIHVPKNILIKIWEKLPDDAMLTAASFDITTNTHCLIVWSDKFETRNPAAEIPRISAIIKMPEEQVTLVKWNYQLMKDEELKWD